MNQDLKLVRQTQQGDKQAFTKLYELYFEQIYRFCFYKTSNKSQAEDLTQEVFLKALKNINNFQAKSSFKNWLYGIAKHTIMDFYRQYYKQPKVNLEEWHWVENLALLDEEEQEQIKEDKEQKVVEMLSKLKFSYRQVLNLRFLRGYSIKETAKELGLTQVNVKVIQYRALQKLKKAGKNDE